MMTLPAISREQLSQQLPDALSEYLRSGIEEAAELIADARTDPSVYELDAVTRHISSIMIDSTGRLVVKTFGGDLFLYRVHLTEV